MEVARLLNQAGFSEPVVAAALLHDVVEDTAIDLDEICQDFGPEIQQLVSEMTEDEEIETYGGAQSAAPRADCTQPPRSCDLRRRHGRERSRHSRRTVFLGSESPGSFSARR